MKSPRMIKLWCLGAALIATLWASGALASSTRVCHHYQDGCTICDFFGPNGEYQGYIEWCF